MICIRLPPHANSTTSISGEIYVFFIIFFFWKLISTNYHKLLDHDLTAIHDVEAIVGIGHTLTREVETTVIGCLLMVHGSDAGSVVVHE